MKKIVEDLEEAKLRVKDLQLQHKNHTLTVSTLVKSIQENGNQRETRLKNLEKKIKSLKSDMQSAQKQLKVLFPLFSFLDAWNSKYLSMFYLFYCWTSLSSKIQTIQFS